MATPGDQLPPWEIPTATDEGPPPWEEAAQNAEGPPPWEEAAQMAEPAVAAPVQAPAASTPDAPSLIDKTGSFLSWYVNTLREAPLLSGKGSRRMLQNLAIGLDETIFGVLKAPGQAAEAIQNIGEEKPFELTWKAPVSSTLIASSRALDRLQKDILPPTTDETPFEDKLTRAAGGALAFMGGGAMLQAAGYSPWLATAALGGAAGASAQYDEAIAMGATPEQAAIAYAGGGAFGLTEAVPGTLFLNKLNKMTGGKVLEQIKQFNQAGRQNSVIEAVKGALTEAAQEGVQTVGGNWVASDLAGYDASRTLGENFWENVATGGIIGSFFGGGINILRNAEKNRVLQEMDMAYDLRKMSGDPINLIEGSFTPVEDLVRLRQLSAFADEELAKRTQQAVGEYQAEANEFGQRPEIGIIPEQFQGIEYIGTKAGSPGDYTLSYLDKPVDPLADRGLPTGTTVRAALLKSPVVAANMNPYGEILAIIDRNITRLENELKVPGPTGWSHVGETTVKKQLEILKAQRLELMAKTDIVKRLVAQVKSYAAAFRQVFTPETRIVLDATNRTDIAGRMSYTTGVVLDLAQPPVDVVTIWINADALATETYNNKKAALSEEIKGLRRKLFETINHELGHAITIQSFNKLFKTITTGSIEEATKARETMILLEQEYRRWLQAMAVGKHADLLKTQFAFERAVQFSAAPDIYTPVTGKSPWKAQKDYLYSFDEFFAEMTARLATQGSFADPVMTRFFSPVLQQYQEIFQEFPTWAQSEYGGDWKAYLDSRRLAYKLTEELDKVIAGGGRDIISVIRHGLPGYNPENFKGLKEHLDRFDKLISWGFNLIQLAKENPHIPALQQYLKATAAWAEYQRNFQADANDVYKAWRSLGKIEAAQLSEVLFEEALSRKPFTGVELQQRLSAEAQSVYALVRQQLDRVLEEMRAVATQDLQRTILDNEELLNAEMQQLNEDFDKMKSQGYFPFIRFGKYTITARAKEDLVFNGESYKRGQLMSFPSFETEHERDEVIRELRLQLRDKAHVASSVMRETDFVIQGMPRSILRSLRNKLEATGDFTPDMVAAFERVASETAPFRNFRKHFLKKKGIHGYSEDALRSFAYYIRSAAGHIARVRFNDDLRSSIDLLQQDVDVIKETGGRADERQEMRHWLDRHFSYIMNPGNELAALRGVGFVAYLGFNVKSALVNSLQIMTTVAPYLAARYGDGKTISEMTKATWTLKDWVLKRKEYIAAMDAADKGKATSGQLKQAALGKMIARGIHEGWLDQSLATELAIAASENNLDRGSYLPKARRFWHEVSRWSALPFHLVEKMNRYLTAIAAYNLETQASGNYEKAVLAARQANWSTNYENARWNRPEFMRGKKSAFFLFGNYLQNTLYFATHDPGAVRYWLMMLLLAGFMGLPGAEDVTDLADFAATYLNRILGLKNPKTQLRVELREHLEELGANPDLILHGLSQDSFGLGHVGELTGIPIPHLDVSRSVGLGDVMPLTEVPSMMLQAKPNDILVAAATSAAGASGSLVEQYYRSLMSSDPDDWKRLERLLPMTAAKNLSGGLRLYQEGVERTQGGQIIAQWDTDSLRDQLELLGKSLGFSPSKQVLGWERQIAQQDMIQYYKVQQEGLLRQLGWAFFQEDREARADVLSAIRRYNEQVPLPEMKLGSDTIRDSLKSYLQKRQMGAMGVAAEKKYRRLRESVEGAYPDPYGNENRDPAFVP